MQMARSVLIQKRELTMRFAPIIAPAWCFPFARPRPS